MNRTSLKSKDGRTRLTIDLAPYPDVERMLERAMSKNPGTKRTYWLIQSLKRHLASEGYAGKRELAK